MLTLFSFFSGSGKAWGDSVIATVDVGDFPNTLEYNPANNNMYVANRGSGTVSVIDSSTNTVIETIDVHAEAIEYNPANNNMYVANGNSGTVSVIDSSTNTVIETIDVDLFPILLEYNPSNNNMYVANRNHSSMDTNSVSVIDSSTNTVVDTIDIGFYEPQSIVFNPDNNNIYVGTYFPSSTLVIDSSTNTVVDTIGTGRVTVFEYNPNNNNMYAAISGPDLAALVRVIDSSNTVIETIDVDPFPIELEYNPANNNMYVAFSNSESVSVIDSSTNTVIKDIKIGYSNTLEYNPANNNMYVANRGSGTVSVIDSSTNTVIETIAVDNGPVALEYNPANNNMYVANRGSGTVSVIDTLTPLIKPIADSGPDQTVESGSKVQLDGSGSSANGGSPIASYQWTQTSGPSITLDDPTSTIPSFTAPQTEGQEIIVFQLVVTNENGVESEPDSVTITVNPIILPPPPIADSGPDQTVDSGSKVPLDGSGSSDPSDGTLTYQWTRVSGPEVSLDDPTSVHPSFNAPDTEVQDTIVFELIVTNKQGVKSEPDSVTITVNPVAPPPLEGILGSGNNINIQDQENSGNNVAEQSENGNMYSDGPIFQGQSTEQDSNVIS